MAGIIKDSFDRLTGKGQVLFGHRLTHPCGLFQNHVTMFGDPNLMSRKYPLPESERLSERIKVRVTKGEKAAIIKTAENLGYEGNVSEFIREFIMRIVKTEGKGVEAVMAQGKVTTDGWQRIPDLDLPPMEIVWDTDEDKPKLVEVE